MEASLKKEEAIRAVRDERIAEERLRSLLGMGMEKAEIELTPSPVSPKEAPLPSELLDKAYLARPDLRAAELAIEAAGHKLGWERSRIFDLTAMLDANGEGKEGFEMGPGIQLGLPVFNQNNGRIKRAQAEMERAARHYLVIKERICQAVKEAHAKYAAAGETLEVLREEVISAADNAHMNAEEAYKVGQISYLELLDHKGRLFESLLRAAEAEAALKMAQFDLDHSIGFDTTTKDKSTE